MPKFIQRFLACTLALSALLITACTQSTPTRFYNLSYAPDEAPNASSTTTREGIAIGVGPIEFPQYLEGADIVTRSSPTKLEMAELDNWGGDLADSFARVLAENLSAILETDRVSIYPWSLAAPVDYQIALRVTAFETSETGDSLLEVRWSVLDPSRGQVLLMAKSSLREGIGPAVSEEQSRDRYEMIVGAMSANVLAFSREVAERIKGLAQQ